MSLLGLGATVALAVAAGRADAGSNVHQGATARRLRAIRADVDHYRLLAWSFERVAHERRTPTAFSYRRSADPAYLHWTLGTWEKRAYVARRHALVRLRRATGRPLLQGPGPHAALAVRLRFSKDLALHLRRIYPGGASQRYAVAHAGSGEDTLQLWQHRSAAAALQVAAHPHGPVERREPEPQPQQKRRLLDASAPLVGEFLCIHRFEGAWTADTGNGYYGGLQMDLSFMRTYGSRYLRRWGTADGWPAWAQVEVAERAYRSGRGFWPWPKSARACGLL